MRQSTLIKFAARYFVKRDMNLGHINEFCASIGNIIYNSIHIDIYYYKPCKFITFLLNYNNGKKLWITISENIWNKYIDMYNKDTYDRTYLYHTYIKYSDIKN
jgi:hypothetical protein